MPSTNQRNYDRIVIRPITDTGRRDNQHHVLLAGFRFEVFRPGRGVLYRGRKYTVGWVLLRRNGLFISLRETGELVPSDRLQVASSRS